jgi:hypothetical protein
MRKSVILVAATLVTLATPVSAIGLGDLAKAVLGGNSVLKKAETKCGTEAKLSAGENQTIDAAIAAVRQAIAPDRFATLDDAARVEADTQSQSETFCPETKKKKKGILSKIGKAGKAILKSKALGI